MILILFILGAIPAYFVIISILTVISWVVVSFFSALAEWFGR